MMTKKEKLAKKITDITGGDPVKLEDEFTTFQLQELLKTVSLIPEKQSNKTPVVEKEVPLTREQISERVRSINLKKKSSDPKIQEEAEKESLALAAEMKDQVKFIPR